MQAEREEGTKRGTLTGDDHNPTQRSVHLDEDTMAISEPPPLPKLRLVTDAKEDEKAAWPFGEDPGSMVASAPAAEVDDADADTNRGSAERFGARKRSADATVGGNLERFPLPPPTEFGAPDVEIRNEESVVAEAMHIKSDTMWRVKQYARRASTVMSKQTYAIANSLGDQSVAAIRRFESLPRQKQLLWVAAPYFVAAILVVVLLQVRTGEPQAATNAIPALPETTEVADATDNATDDVDVPLVAPRKKVADDDIGDPDIGAGVERTLPRRTRLFSRPEAGPHSAKLRKGAKVKVFPDFPAPDGFVLAQSAKGTVGFLSVLHLEGENDPAIDKKRKRRRRR